MNLTPVMRCLALLASAHALAADLHYKLPDCAPYAEREHTTPDSMLARHTLVSWYGDSRTVSACFSHLDDKGNEQYSTLRQTMPMLASGGRSYKQRAANGTSLRGLLAGKAGLNRPWAEQVRTDDAEVMVIAYSTNDATDDYQAKRQDGVGEFAAELTSAVAAARAAGHKVLLLQPYPACDYLLNEDDTAHPVLPKPNTLLAPYAAAIERVGATQGVKVARLYSLPTRCDAEPAASDMPDGLHPTLAYTRMAARIVAAALDEVMAEPAPKPSPTPVKRGE